MKAEILITGNEISSGRVQDVNGRYIANKLEQVGIRVSRITVVGDGLPDISSAISEMAERADLCVVTGGLGPTADDVTAAAAAHAAGVPVEENPVAREWIESYFNRKNRTTTESNYKQAMLPEGAVCLENQTGTAPGFRISLSGATLFFLPGVPREMHGMLEMHVMAFCRELPENKAQYPVSRTLSIFGLPEAGVGDLLASVEAGFPDIQVGYRARFPEIRVSLTGYVEQQGDTPAFLDAAVMQAKNILGSYVYAEDNISLAESVGASLLASSATVAIAESCTGGLIAHQLTGIPGSSAYFLFSGVTYANQAKEAFLGVLPETISENGAVHEKTALEMARGARLKSGATYGLSTSGIAGPTGGTPGKPVGTVCIGLSGPGGDHAVTRFLPFADRDMNKAVFAAAALDLLRREIESSR